MKFCCSKIRINGKEVIKSGLFIWEEAGLEKVSYKSSEKEDQKSGKGLKKSNHVTGVLWGYLWDHTAILQVKQDNKPNLLFCPWHTCQKYSHSQEEWSRNFTCQENTWMIRWHITVLLLMLDLMALTSSQALPNSALYPLHFCTSSSGKPAWLFQSKSTSSWKPSTNRAKETCKTNVKLKNHCYVFILFPWSTIKLWHFPSCLLERYRKCNFPNFLKTVFVQPNFPMIIFN